MGDTLVISNYLLYVSSLTSNKYSFHHSDLCKTFSSMHKTFLLESG